MCVGYVATVTMMPSYRSYDKIYGKWYTNAWMGNVDIPNDKKNQKMPPFVIKPISANKIEAKLNLKKNGRCEEIKLILQTTNEPGKMVTWGKQIVGLLNMKVKDNMIIYMEGKMNGKNIIMMQLLGRNSDVNPEAFEIFEEFVRSKGQDVTKIIKPEVEADCIPGRS
ncbi:lipocalin-1-like [Antechinus flavipes]|uniref:lipocalin-1-like n=1 Tax=Antechinus flavipes TaxID=38775 RepID=UPI002236657B|nr:lipocalin-1-like [Antechinus flavipes]